MLFWSVNSRINFIANICLFSPPPTPTPDNFQTHRSLGGERCRGDFKQSLTTRIIFAVHSNSALSSASQVWGLKSKAHQLNVMSESYDCIPASYNQQRLIFSNYRKPAPSHCIRRQGFQILQNHFRNQEIAVTWKTTSPERRSTMHLVIHLVSSWCSELWVKVGVGRMKGCKMMFTNFPKDTWDVFVFLKH